ncbi:MAG TPA: class I SAM-dependent methyltransferase [Acidobacteriota bacterium]|nr:class I SAM-dependent methyltransferase [Acidobacteriota bacterium]
MKSGEHVSRLEGLRSTYDAGYFHGENSGYPKEGYGIHHPDWAPWLKRIASLIEKEDRWLELGCAYGFLVELARSNGYQAVGCDISRFALEQKPAIAPFLAEADVFALPFRSGTLKLITAFDLLEHLNDPIPAAREIYRCLAPDGIVITTTPDPCRFVRNEPTHSHEAPPSHWLSLFEKNGFHADFGFDGADFNLVLAASKSQSQIDGFHRLLLESDPLETQELLESVAARIRTGFHPHPDGWVLGEKNEIYLLNRSDSPISVSLDLSAATTGHNASLLLIADGRVVDRIDLLAADGKHTHRTGKILFNSGGHSLQLQPADGSDAGQIIIGPIQMHVLPASREQLIAVLPFDLFERYHAAALLCQRLPKRPDTVLDYGGYIGDIGGHWADASDFGIPAVFTDIRPADSPKYVSLAESGSRRFDMVLALDVLEHISPTDRRKFLERLDGLAARYLIVAGPFASPAIEAAETRVRQTLLQAGAGSHQFLSEHQTNGLPAREEILRWISVNGYAFCEIEGMSAHMWETLQKTSLKLAHYQQYRTLEKLNQSINVLSLWSSGGEPYRHFFFISKDRAMAPFFDLPRAKEPAALLAFLEQQPEILSAETIRQRGKLLFLLNETQKHVQLLRNEVQLLENQARGLENHARELENLLQAERQKPLAKIARQRLRKRLKREK